MGATSNPSGITILAIRPISNLTASGSIIGYSAARNRQKQSAVSLSVLPDQAVLKRALELSSVTGRTIILDPGR
jgi:hypothetical protein